MQHVAQLSTCRYSLSLKEQKIRFFISCKLGLKTEIDLQGGSAKDYTFTIQKFLKHLQKVARPKQVL